MEMLQSRSQQYQYLIVEKTYSDKVWSKILNPIREECKEHHQEELLELKDNLVNRIKEIVKDKLPERRQIIFDMYFLKGYNQLDISKSLNIRQSSIHKILKGINNKNGLIRDLIKLCSADKICQEILKNINELPIS